MSDFDEFSIGHPPPMAQSLSNEPPHFKFHPNPFDECEDIEKYEPGGYHPVHLTETFDDGRYQIVHKLGYGGFSTVWMARDRQDNQYVSLKVVIANDSDSYKDYSAAVALSRAISHHPGKAHIASFLDHFWHQGPHGRHLCLVSEVLGPSASRMSGYGSRLYPEVARAVALQVAQGLAYMHSQQICHGDLTCSNVLFQLSEQYDHLSLEELYAKLGQPEQGDIYRVDGEALGPSDPQSVVDSIDPFKNASQIRPLVKLIDFDQSFPVNDPPKCLLGTPSSHLAPEAILDLAASSASDTWALGCVIFRLRAGFDLFAVFGTGSLSDALAQMVRVLGRFPKVWESVRYDDDGVPIRSAYSEDGSELVTEPLSEPLLDKISDIKDQPTDTNGSNDYIFWTPPRGYDQNEGSENEEEAGMGPKIPSAEAESLFDLLSSIFRYDPNQRPSVEEILKHPWFLKSQ